MLFATITSVQIRTVSMVRSPRCRNHRRTCFLRLLLQTTTHVLSALIAYPRSEQLVDAYDRDAGVTRGANMPIDQLNVQRAVQHLCILLGTDYVPVKKMPIISQTLDSQATAPPKTPLRTRNPLARASVRVIFDDGCEGEKT